MTKYFRIFDKICVRGHSYKDGILKTFYIQNPLLDVHLNLKKLHFNPVNSLGIHLGLK